MKNLPVWLRKKYVFNLNNNLENIFKRFRINTVCKNAKCPNSNECFSKNTATFMILGDVCTRRCLFCSVEKGNKAIFPDEKEFFGIIEAIKSLCLKYIVVTSPTRDDLEDGGAGHFAKLIKLIKHETPDALIEVLVPDFKGDERSLRKIIEADPDVFGHNIEMVPSLYPVLRPMGNFNRSTGVLKFAKSLKKNILTKSSIILGFGETDEEVLDALRILRDNYCDIIVIGQYLRPGESEIPVKEFISPDKFEYYKKASIKIGFKAVLSEPFARSSYKAEEIFKEACLVDSRV